MKKKLLFAAVIVMMTSCLIDFDLPNEENLIADDRTVSIDEALAEMYKFMDEAYGPKTRAATRRVASVETFKNQQRGIVTRADSRAEFENVAYIVNFEDNGGFAVLGANRDEESIVCIAEAGSLTVEDILNAGQTRQELATRTQTSPPPNGGQQIPPPVDGQQNAPPLGTRPNNGGPIVNTPVIPLLRNHLVPPENGVQNQLSQNGEALPLQQHNHMATINKIGPLLKNRKWNQSPYLSIYTNSMHVGCVALAVTQIIVHNEFPELSEFNMHGPIYSTWAELKSVVPYSYSKDTEPLEYRVNDDLSKLVHHVGVQVKTQYAEKGSGAYNSDALNYMNRLGYKAEWLYLDSKIGATGKFDAQWKLNTELSNGKPMYVSALNDNGISAHAWVIDGVIVQRLMMWNGSYYFYYVGEDTRMFHCVYGWGGIGDGYYNEGLFCEQGFEQLDKVDVDTPTTDVNMERQPMTNSYTKSITVMKYSR